jgi:polysaccharide pyruvyl transferase WcaK-like protein
LTKTLLLNDTSEYHSGCAEVIKTYRFDHSIKTNGEPNINFKEYSIVILNGEGTMHHSDQNRPNTVKFLNALRSAQQAGCETHLLNTVWQSISNDYDDVLKRCKTIEVRDVISQRELKLKHGIDSVVVPDRSIRSDVPYMPYEYRQIYKGGWFISPFKIKYHHREISIFHQSWNEIVNRLRHAELLVTGRHHEAYAAIKAGCKFIVLPSNSHKNEGIYLNAKVKPINKLDMIEEVLNGKYDDEFKAIGRYYKKYM